MSAEAIARAERVIAWVLGGILALNLMLVLAYVCAWLCQRFNAWWESIWRT